METEVPIDLRALPSAAPLKRGILRRTSLGHPFISALSLIHSCQTQRSLVMSADLDRFIQAQEDSYATALTEMEQGSKQTHWMWFIFPQLKGLGRSSTAPFYALNDKAEARAVLDIRSLRLCGLRVSA
jgi:Protein of unknown function (DUF1810)